MINFAGINQWNKGYVRTRNASISEARKLNSVQDLKKVLDI